MPFRPTMKILFGPPGTGKTWRAAREAVATVMPDEHAAWVEGRLSDEELLELHHSLVLGGRIKWVTFHPSYTYEDFVEGFRPIQGLNNQTLSFAVRKGPFREVADVAAGRPSGFGPPVGAVIAAVGGKKTYEVAGANDQGWFLRVRPDRADQVGEEQEKFVTRRTIERAAELKLEPRVFSIPGKGDVIPADYGLPGDVAVVGSELRRQVAGLLGLSSSDFSNSAHFGAVATYVKAQEATAPQPTPACLVIDEINRADLSRVFGELITLLEPDKRIGAAEERRVHLPYSGEERFGVPLTLSVIGTMNTADRSITAMDFAMRRRFTFEEVGPEPLLVPERYGGAVVRAAFKGINRRVAVLRGRDFRLGHSTFMEPAFEDVRSRFAWADDDVGRIRAVAYVFRRRVVPLLLEYFHEDWRKIEVAMGVRARTFGASGNGFFTAEVPTDADASQFEDVFDTEGAVLGEPAAWWDPEDEAFDAGGFADAVSAMA